MNRPEILKQLKLDPQNSVVIGSGIMGKLGIRASDDLDLVVKQSDYERLAADSQFHLEVHYGREILVGDKIEIGTDWKVFGEPRDFDKLMENSVVIDSVRYCALDFIYDVKKYWIDRKDSPRAKDFRDLELIDEYRKMGYN